jgi:hypothetical protein
MRADEAEASLPRKPIKECGHDFCRWRDQSLLEVANKLRIPTGSEMPVLSYCAFFAFQPRPRKSTEFNCNREIKYLIRRHFRESSFPATGTRYRIL